MPDGTVDMQPAIAQASATSAKKPTLKVVFDHLDLDTLLCLWALIFKMSKRYNVVPILVDSGERLRPEETEVCDVVYVDMGGGPCDHHGKGLVNTSSFVLVAEQFGFVSDPGMSVLLDLSRRVDNAQEVGWDSIAFAVTNTLHNPWFRHVDSDELDVTKILEFVSILFDGVYKQTFARHKAKKDYDKGGVTRVVLENGVVVVLIPKPSLRDEAFRRGADVAMWYSHIPGDPSGAFTVQIAVNRANKTIDLTAVAEMLRKCEIRSRRFGEGLGDAALDRIIEQFVGLDMVETHPQVPGWYLHDSLRLILCGSKKHPLKEGDTTTMPLAHIFAVLCHQLSLSGQKTEEAAAA